MNLLGRLSSFPSRSVYRASAMVDPEGQLGVDAGRTVLKSCLMGKSKVSANDSTLAAVLPSGDSAETPAVESRSPISLRIHGDELFLSGAFHRWQAAASSGPDLDLVSVHMAVDATSPDQLTVDPHEHPLLSFASKKVTKLGHSVFSAEGVMKIEGAERPCDVLVEIPEGHNSFFALAFVVRKEFLGGAWRQLVGRAGTGGIDAERLLDPRAGLRGMELAAA